MIRDILDVEGVKIGELSLPDDTPEEVWQERLAEYLKAPVIEMPQITARQIRLGIIEMGLPLAAIDAAIDSLEEPAKSKAKVEWEYANYFDRSNPLINAVGASIGASTQELDALWIRSSAL